MLRPLIIALLLTSSALLFAEPVTITLKTQAGQMRYDLNEIIVVQGSDVQLTFENADDLPHNLVFFKAGTDPVAICNKQMETPEVAMKRDWLPEDPAVWLHSKMLAPKEKQVIDFKAPTVAGSYPFACTFPGHVNTMQGRLRVLPFGPTLTNLKFKVYLGDWSKLPDFTKLTPHREGNLPDNEVDIKLDDYQNQFGVVYEGQIKAPKAGEYTFSLASDDGSRLLIDSKVVIDHDGIHPAHRTREGKVKLTEGPHDFRLEYFQTEGILGLFVAWKSADFAMTPLSKSVHPQWSEAPGVKKPVVTTGMPLVVGKEPIVYRNFIAGSGNRTIAVGYPGGVSLAWNATTLNLALVWRGAFMDAARHWTARGGGYQPPLGFDVIRPTGANASPFATTADASWPAGKANVRPEDYQWLGYQLDAKRYPIFKYSWKGVQVTDSFEVLGDGFKGDAKLVRTLKLSGKIPENALFQAAMGDKITAKGGEFLIKGGKLEIPEMQPSNEMQVSVEGGRISGQSLVVPVRSEIKVVYSWPTNH